MDKVTRKELKSDRFALEVEHSVEYVSLHKKPIIKWGAVALGVLVVAVGFYWYGTYQHHAREAALGDAMQILNSTVGPAQSEFQITYPSQVDKDQAIAKAFTDIATKYSGTDEGYRAEYYLGSQAADKGDLTQAAKRFQLVADSADKGFASLAKLALGQIYASQGKPAEAEKLIRSVMNNPTILVSKEQATIALARILSSSNPQEARKLLEPLRASQRSAVSRAALTALGEIPQK